MNSIPSNNFYEIERVAEDFNLQLNDRLSEFKKCNYEVGSIENAKQGIQNLYNKLELDLKFLAEFNGYTYIIQERDDYCINIPVQDQRQYFEKVYNGRVIEMLDKRIRWLCICLSMDVRLKFPEIYHSAKTDKPKYAELNKELTEKDRIKFRNIFKDWYDAFEVSNESNNLNLAISDQNKSIELESIKPKILVLRELGIIELLNNKFNSNNSDVAECIGVLINVKPSSIRGILSNLNGQKNNNTNPENIRSLENAIIVLNNLGCSTEVLNLQNKLSKLI